jgi:hypothetical protein
MKRLHPFGSERPHIRPSKISLEGVESFRGLLRASLAAVVFFCAAPAAHAADPEQEIVWQSLSPGLEQSHFQLSSGTLLSPWVVAVRADLRHFRPQVIRAADFGWKRASVKALCKASNASVCINSNFFDEQGKPLGLVLSRGILHQKTHNGGGTLTGILYVASDRVGIAHRSSFNPDGVVEATQAGPRLISEGAPVVGLKTPSSGTNLSIACVDREQRVILVRVAFTMFGGSPTDIQRALLRPEIACVEALNFDGGGSSQMYISGTIPGHVGAVREEDFPGRDEVPVALALAPLK